MDLDFMPSPDPERPGLVLRDPFQYSDRILIVPPALVPALELFDGASTPLDLREFLVRLTGELDVTPLEQNLSNSLSEAGFLENEHFERRREQRHEEFRKARVRQAAHAGQAYPEDPAEARKLFDEYLAPEEPRHEGNLIAIAAPHVSPFGGIDSYRAAYKALSPLHRDKVFVILGTSHYGEPERFGLTHKNFVTPFGESSTERAWVDELAHAAPEAVEMEDYCHATEHSIEFQVAFLQHIYTSRLAGFDQPPLRILPILCGSFAHSLYEGGLPEADEGVKRFLGALGELAARERDHLVFVLGVDMAHMGRRYGDPIEAKARENEMIEVERRDHARIAALSGGDAQAYWELVQQNNDDLKWCGSAPFYTFSRAVPEARGKLLRYGQWNIDPQSVVSFAGMSFTV